MRKLYQIIIYDGKAKVFDENFSFTLREPNEEDIISFLKLIQPDFLLVKPDFIFDKIEWNYIRELKDSEL